MIVDERPDPLVKPVFVELGGKTYRLHYDCWCVAITEQELGISIMPPLQSPFWQRMGSVYNTVALLFMGTRLTAPQLTFREIGQLATGPQYGELVKSSDRAFMDFFRTLLAGEAREAWDTMIAAVSSSPAGSGGSDATTPPDTPSESGETNSGGSPSENSTG